MWGILRLFLLCELNDLISPWNYLIIVKSKHFVEFALLICYFSLEDKKLTLFLEIYDRGLSFNLLTQVKHLVDSFSKLLRRGNSVSGLDCGVEDVKIQIVINFDCI